MTIRQFFTDLFADDPEPPDRWAEIDAEMAALCRAGQSPMVARITIGQGHGQSIMLPVPSSATREQAYAALQAHYEAEYGPHVIISVGHLCSAPEDRDEPTWRHSAKVEAVCSHGLISRLCTVDVVTQRSDP